MKRPQHALVAGHRLVLLCGVVPAIITAVLALYRPAFLANLDFAVYDSITRRAGTDPPSGRVVIVDIDERSLSAIGQWPWRRDVIGQLIGRLRELGAASIALDVVFAEPDRYDRLADTVRVGRHEESSRWGVSTSPDASFADTLRHGRVVLGYALTFEESVSGSSTCVLHPLGVAIVQPRDAGTEPPLFRASGAVCSLPVLARAAGASGFLNAAPDGDGILRRVPLLLELDGRVYPGLALAAVVAATGTREIALRVVNVNAISLILDNRIVPLDGRSHLLLRYRGKRRTFRYVSAADVVGGPLPSDTFKDKIVFIGATALGTREVVATPLDTQFASVEVQATVADNLLRQDFIRRPEHAVSFETQAVLGMGIAVALLVGWAGLAWGSLGVVVCLTALWGGGAWLLSTKGAFLSPLFPTIGLISALAAMTLAKFSVERRRAEQAGEEKTISQRLMVQTLLSLTEVRDAETGRHSRRTRRYARLLAEQLSAHPRFRDYLTPKRIDLLASLAPLHDIGKVGVPDRLLNKPGALSGDELAEMRKHPAHGREVILQAEQRVGARDDAILAMAKEIVYTHHERWDGTGYPEGLLGEQIPIAGRLIALVDVFDALITRRAYRQPMSHDEAVDLIVEGRGTHFDPAVVDAFLQVAPVLRNMSNETELSV